MNIDLVTLFAEFFETPLATGLVGKAIAAGRASVRTIDPRQFTQDRHRTVDDTPYGGGGGMVMKPEPVVAAIREARSRGSGPVVLMSPQGRPLVQRDFARWASVDHLVLVAGRYEGYDERIRAYVDDEVSLGDFVLTGGEYAALTIVDGVIRLRPGTLGNKDCPEQDSFADGLLEYPHYTRPLSFEGNAVPEVLQSGHHQRVSAWRNAQALLRTRIRRPDLLKRRGLSPAEADALASAWNAAAAPDRAHAAAPDSANAAVAPAAGTGLAPEGPLASDVRTGPVRGSADAANVVRTPRLLVAWPAARATFEALAVARAFGVERVFIVAPDGDRAATEDAVAALPIQTYPRREGPRSRKQRRAPAATVEVDVRRIATVIEGWHALPADWAGRPVAPVVVARRPPIEARFVDPFELLSSEQSTPVVMFDAPEAVGAGYLPVVRAAEIAHRLPFEALLGIYLDRIVGEG